MKRWYRSSVWWRPAGYTRLSSLGADALPVDLINKTSRNPNFQPPNFERQRAFWVWGIGPKPTLRTFCRFSIGKTRGGVFCNLLDVQAPQNLDAIASKSAWGGVEKTHYYKLESTVGIDLRFDRGKYMCANPPVRHLAKFTTHVRHLTIFTPRRHFPFFLQNQIDLKSRFTRKGRRNYIKNCFCGMNFLGKFWSTFTPSSGLPASARTWGLSTKSLGGGKYLQKC